MAKLSTISLQRKKELSQPDEFITLTSRAIDFATDHKNTLIGVVCGLLIIIVGIVGFQYYAAYKADKASLLLVNATDAYNKINTDKNPEAALEGTRDQLEKLINAYSGTPAGKAARLKLADAFFQSEQYDKAVALYNDALKIFQDQPTLRDIAQIGLAYAYEAKGDRTTAIQHFQKIADQKTATYKADALFHLGILYRESGDTDSSAAAFKKIVDTYSNSPYAAIAQSQIAG